MDVATVALYDVLDDGQAQSVAAGLAAARFFEAVETVEKVDELCAVDVGAIIGRREDDFIAFLFQAQADAAAGDGILQGIVEEIFQDPGQAVGVAEERSWPPKVLGRLFFSCNFSFSFSP